MQHPRAGGRKPSEEVENVRAHGAKLERIKMETGRPRDTSAQLDKVRAEWEETFNATRDSIMVVDGELKIVRANLATLHFFGKPLEQIVGKSCWQVVHGTEKPPEKCPLKKALSTKRHENAEFYVPGKDAWIEVSASPILDHKGNMVKLVHVIRDITERKQSEESLREREELLELFFSQSLDGFFFMMLDEPIRWDDTVEKEDTLDYVFAHQRITKVNDAMFEQYGSSQEQFLGRTPSDFYAHDIAYGRDLWERLFDAGRLHVETHERKIDGTPIWIEGDFMCLYDSEGRITGHFGVQRDTTERNRTEAALRESEQHYRMLAETMNDGLGQIDKDGTCVYANERYGEILGYSADEIVGRHFAEVFDREAQEVLAEQLAKRRKGIAKPYEIATTRKDGRKISLRISPRCLLDTDGTFMGSIAIMADITDRKKISDQLHNDREKLKAMASKLLLTQERERRLLAVELHDNICQGLVLIKLALESSLHLISDTNVLASVKIACGAIGETIEEAESLTFALSNPVLHQFGFVAALEKYLAEEIHKKYGIKCKLDSRGHLGELHDETKTCLFRVTRELLTNVVKHAHATKIMVRVHKSGGTIRVTVQDDGVGFKDSHADSRASETTRFGLFSVREQLEYLGGNIRIKSKPGRGTTAMIVVPLREKAIV